MSTTIVRLLSCVALLGVPACGDDGGGSGSEGSSTGGSSTGAGSTSTEPGSTSTAGNEGSGSGSSGPSEGSTTTGADSGSSGGSGTGAVLECDELADLETCEAAMGCLWLGNMQNGACLPDDATICPELEMQQCQLHPLCDWSNQDAACMPVM